MQIPILSKILNLEQIHKTVCVHNRDFNIAVFRDVKAYTGWNLQSNKIMYVNVAEGTSITDAEEYAEELGLITEITHKFGKDGFYTEFTVDSGGTLGKGRLVDYISQITKERTDTSRTYE